MSTDRSIQNPNAPTEPSAAAPEPMQDLLRESHHKLISSLDEQKRLLQKLESLEKDFHTIFDSVPAMIW
jgi:PAS domain-containing protein